MRRGRCAVISVGDLDLRVGAEPAVTNREPESA